MMKSYSGDRAQKIAFPLSGIGTGGVSLSGTGRLIDWELTGRADKGNCNEYTHFAVKAERNGSVIDARVLHGDVTEELGGTALASHHHSWGYGQGINRTSMAGLPHFGSTVFTGRFPFAEMEFESPRMPAAIRLTAFNPFIPGDEDESSLPCAFFEWEIKNTSDEATDYTLAFSAGDPFRISEGGCSAFGASEGISSVTLKSRRLSPEDRNYGELVISTDCPDVSYQEYWYRSGWFDDLTTFWKEFSAPGRLKNRRYDDDDRHGQLDIGDMTTLAAHVSLAPGESRRIRFVMAWYFPRFEKYWDEERPVWKHEYARRFSSAANVLAHCYKNAGALYERSKRFSDALCAMTIPAEAAEAAADNLCVLKSPTCLRLENGEFWAFEGTNATSGSCEGTCDHVWGYQYALPFLFPRFARQTIETDYTYDMKDSGEVMFRTMLPLGAYRSDFRACVDGQMGLVLRFYREWKLCGDDEWLKTWWPKVRKSLEYAWSPENRDRWDPDRTGVISGRQHHTLDVELFGPNAWLNGFYLAALKAGGEIAAYLGEDENAALYQKLFENGKEFTERELFNGRHYVQKADIKNKAVLDPYAADDPGVYGYWNDEKNELKYQIGQGCSVDQLLSQMHATLIGLGDIFDPVHRRTAARTLYEMNFRSMRDIFNPCRVFASNDERGLIVCSWADESEKPKIPVPYTEECMTGMEYAAAALMIEEGLTEEGGEVIRAARERYDGKKRDPFSEIECGASYSRSMSSFAFPAVYAGYRFDMVKKEIGFDPVTAERPFCSFWSVDGAWGTVTVEKTSLTLRVMDGALSLNSFVLPESLPAASVVTAAADGHKTAFTADGKRICFRETVTAAERLEFRL